MSTTTSLILGIAIGLQFGFLIGAWWSARRD
jgi:hypothetical protein